jgi:hypothetical protein
MLLATEFGLPFVQRQVGRADSKLALDVYHQLLDRSKRAHGEAFDTLVADARTTCTARAMAILPHYVAHRPISADLTKIAPGAICPGTSRIRCMGAAGFEPATSRV